MAGAVLKKADCSKSTSTNVTTDATEFNLHKFSVILEGIFKIRELNFSET